MICKSVTWIERFQWFSWRLSNLQGGQWFVFVFFGLLSLTQRLRTGQLSACGSNRPQGENRESDDLQSQEVQQRNSSDKPSVFVRTPIAIMKYRIESGSQVAVMIQGSVMFHMHYKMFLKKSKKTWTRLTNCTDWKNHTHTCTCMQNHANIGVLMYFQLIPIIFISISSISTNWKYTFDHFCITNGVFHKSWTSSRRIVGWRTASSVSPGGAAKSCWRRRRSKRQRKGRKTKEIE